MQDEILKHTTKIYKVAKKSNHTLIEKIKEIAIEICIIVFAVSLSIWFHGWAEHRHEQAQVRAFMQDIKEDIASDIKSLTKEKDSLLLAYKMYENLWIYRTTDSGTWNVNFHLITRRTNNGIYEGFKSAGKIGLIENDKFKKAILEYYQEVMPPLEEMEKSYNSHVFSMLEHINDLTPDKEKNKYIWKKIGFNVNQYVHGRCLNRRVHRQYPKR